MNERNLRLSHSKKLFSLSNGDSDPMKMTFVFIISLMVGITVVYADHNLHLYELANKAYEKGEYRQAIQHYEEIIGNGYEAWQVYYNLGNAYYKQNNLGKALLNYERARRLASDNEDVQFNLDLANVMVVDKIVEPPEFLPFKIIESIKGAFSLNAWTWLAGGAYLLVMLVIIVRIISRRRIVLRLARVLVPVTLIVFIFAAIVLGLRMYDIKTIHHGIVLADEVIVRASPEMSATELFTIHEGLKVQVRKENGNWYQIRLRDGKVGWLNKETVEII